MILVAEIKNNTRGHFCERVKWKTIRLNVPSLFRGWECEQRPAGESSLPWQPSEKMLFRPQLPACAWLGKVVVDGFATLSELFLISVTSHINKTKQNKKLYFLLWILMQWEVLPGFSYLVNDKMSLFTESVNPIGFQNT